MSGRCRYCGRELSDPVSIARGYGDECGRRHFQLVSRRVERLRELPERERMHAVFSRPMRKRWPS